MIIQVLFFRLSLFQKYSKIVAIDLKKKQVFDTHPKAIQQFNFTENLDRSKNTAVLFSILKKQMEIFCIFHKTLCEYCQFILL